MEGSSQEIIDNSVVVIVDHFKFSETIKETFKLKYSTFKLCKKIGKRMIEVYKWYVLIMSCRGGHFFSKFCIDEISQYQPIKIEIFPDNLPNNYNYTILYV